MWKWLIISLGIVLVTVYFGYHFLINKGSEVMINQIASQLVNNEEEFQSLLSDPDIQRFLESGSESAEPLPFETKEEALKVVINEFSISEMNMLIEQAQKGEISPEKLYDTLQERLTDEEIQALKIIALREVQQN